MFVALTAYNRPGYLKRVVESIEVASERVFPEPVFLVAQVEPSEVQAEVLDAIGDGRGRYVTVNSERLGHVRNIRETIQNALDLAARFQEDFVVHLPDDIILAPDAFECLAWIRDTFRNDPKVLCSSLFSKADTPLTRWREVSFSTTFNSQGFGVWRDKWPHFTAVWEPIESKREPGRDPAGYRGIDYSIADLFDGSGRYLQARPHLSRVSHIGLNDGMHTTFETYQLDAPRLFAGDVEVDFEEPWWYAQKT